MADDGFVIARPPGGGAKRRVPKHYLEPPFNFKLPPSTRAEEPVTRSRVQTVKEPVKPDNKKEARS